MADPSHYQIVYTSKHYSRRFGPHGYIEHDNALLDDILSSLGEANQQGDHPKTNETILLPEVEYLHIYCDILRVSVTQDGALLAVAPAPIQWLRIFARSIKTIDSHGHQGEQPLQNIATITLVCHDVDRPFKIAGNTISNQPERPLGRTFNVDANAFVPKVSEFHQINPREFECRQPAAQMLANLGTTEVELSTLVRRILYLAVEGMNSAGKAVPTDRALYECIHNPETISRLQYVIRLTKGVPIMADVNSAASVLLHRLSIPQSVRIMVPRSSFQKQLNILSKWLNAASEIDREYQHQLQTTAIEQHGASRLIQQITQFQFQDAEVDQNSLLKRYLEATNAVSSLASDFSHFKSEMDKANSDFQRSMTEWQAAQRDRAKWNLLFSIVKIVAAVAITVYTMGAASGGAVKSVEDAVRTTADTAKTGKEALDTWGKIKLIVERIGQMQKCMKSVQEAQEAIRRYKSKAGGTPRIELLDVLPPTDTQAFDYFEMLNLWDDFILENETIFDDIKNLDPPVENATEFRVAMKKVVGRARNMIAAQKELQTAEDKLRLAIQHQSLRQGRRDEWSSLASLSEKQLHDSRMLEGLMSMNLRLFLLFQDVFSAFIYETNSSEIPLNITFGNIKKMSEHKSDVAEFEAEYSRHFEDYIRATMPQPLKFHTNQAESIFDQNWKDLLLNDGRVPFKIRVDNPVCKRKCFTSITKAAVFFEGITRKNSLSVTEDLTIPLMIQLGPRMQQLDHDGNSSEFFCSLVELMFDPPFDSTSGSYFHELHPDRLHPTLYTMGWVQIRGFSNNEWDLNSVTGISLQLHIEFNGESPLTPI